MDVHPVGVQVLHVLEHAPALLAQLHDVAHVLRGGVDVGVADGLLGALDEGGVRVVGGVVNGDDAAVGEL